MQVREGVGVSVIVPAFNSSRSIRPCLDSVLSSDFPPERMEVICADNGSTDGTAEIVESYGSAVRLVREATPGPAAARNAGLRAATGPIAAFTDSDCIVDRGWLRSLTAPVADGTADAAGGRILARPQAGPVEMFGELVHDHAKAIEHYRPPYLITMNLAVRTALLREIGGFDERWIRLEDVDATFRLLDAGARIAYVHGAVIRHHNRDTVWKLAREGFLHGYYRPAFLDRHRGFLSRYRESAPGPEPPLAHDPPPAAGRLSERQIRLFWRIFNTGKRAGELTGRWFPPSRA